MRGRRVKLNQGPATWPYFAVMFVGIVGLVLLYAATPVGG